MPLNRVFSVKAIHKKGLYLPDGTLVIDSELLKLREQLCAFFNIKIQYILDSGGDANRVSGYAKDAVQWAAGEGIINGSDGKLLPQGNATYVQVAAILMRFTENIANP